LAVVVSDTSPIRALAHLASLDLLRHLFGEVLIPPAVARELGRSLSGPGTVDVLKLGYIRVETPQDQRRVQEFGRKLDPGEAEALALALEVHAEAILIDEAAGRAMAKQLGLRVVGVLGTLVRAKQRGLIASIRPLLDRLQNEFGFYISASVRAEVLRLVGE